MRRSRERRREMTRPLMRLRWFLAAASVVSTAALSGCKGNCITDSRMDFCDGDVRVYCPGGRGSFPYYRPERVDCRAAGQRCVAARGGPTYTSCWAPLGGCDAASFVPRCEPKSPTAIGGRMTACIRGEELPSGVQCEVAANSAAE